MVLTSRRRELIAASLTMAFLSIPTGGLVEIVRGETMDKVFWSRLISFGINILTSWLYVILRDTVYYKLLHADSDGFWKRMFGDCIVFVLFQGPLYMVAPRLAGIQSKTILVGLLLTFGAGVVFGRPLGIILEWIKKKTHTQPQPQTE